ncbi:MAG: hypothetical protein IT307_15490 [Chloroflexi bacterium]|nr:hypothetical protein [Chloroflexota bacterium]
MSEKSSRYDSELQMFRQDAREASLHRLLFFRWLAENGQLEHEVFGPSCGEYQLALANAPGMAAAPN